MPISVQTRATEPVRPPPRTTLPGDTLTISAPALPRDGGPLTDGWSAIVVQLAQNDKAGAERLLNELLRLEPNHTAARTALGRLYADRGEWVSAQRQCQLALEQDVLCVPAHYLLAQMHEHRGEYDAALAAYRRTLYLDPQFVPGMLGLANSWRQIGNVAHANRAYRNAWRYLSSLPTTAAIEGVDGMTVGDLLALVGQQIGSPA